MCEVKCGGAGLDKADRQNMHSCSVAVKAVLDLRRAADLEKSTHRVKELSGRILVFSISHDDQDARLYGHFAKVDDNDPMQWTYHRYLIRKFDFIEGDGLLTLHNFVQNLFALYVPKFIEQLKKDVEDLPKYDPKESTVPSESEVPIAAPEGEIDNPPEGIDKTPEQDQDQDVFKNLASRPAL